MTTAQMSQKKVRLFDSPLLQESLEKLNIQALEEFSALTQVTRRFHFAFFGLCAFELLSLLILSSISQSLFIAVCLAGLCLTIFSYFLLSFYFDAKKPQQMLVLEQCYLESCKTVLGKERDDPLALAHVLQRLAFSIDLKKWACSMQAPGDFLQTFLEKCLIWIHWKEVHQMQELLLLDALQHYIEVVKMEPVDLQSHAYLAHAYLHLARIYRPRENWAWVPSAYRSKPLLDNFRICTERAIQEFQILDTLAPGESWVHAQLAAIYHELEMPLQEIQHYEYILKLTPQDLELIFRLGVLYFQQGETAKALLHYQRLQEAGDHRAEELISHYHSLSPSLSVFNL